MFAGKVFADTVPNPADEDTKKASNSAEKLSG
jgi:hypothetical protein